MALLLPLAAEPTAFARAWASWWMQLVCDCPTAEALQVPARGCCEDEAPPQGPQASDGGACCCLAQPIPEDSGRTPLERSASSATGDCLRWLNCGAHASARAPAVGPALGLRHLPGWLDPPGPTDPDEACACSPFAARRLSASGAERAALVARL